MDQSASKSKEGPLGGMDLFSLFRIDDNLRQKAEEKLEEAARKHTAVLTKEFNARFDYYKKLGMTGWGGKLGRLDMKVDAEMRKEGLGRPLVHGRVPGVQLGLEINGKPLFWLLGIHDKPLGGISTPKEGTKEFEKGAYCVALSTSFHNEDCKGVITYSGMNTKGSKAIDQDISKPENAALVNNMRSQTPVRVIKKIQELPVTKWKYLGLYDVVGHYLEEEEAEQCKKRKIEAVTQPEAPGVPKKRKVIKFRLERNKDNNFENKTPTLGYRQQNWEQHKNPVSKLMDKAKKRGSQARPSNPRLPLAATRREATGVPSEHPLPSSAGAAGAAGVASAVHQGRQGRGLECTADDEAEQREFAAAVWADLNSPAQSGTDSAGRGVELSRPTIRDHVETSADHKAGKAAAQQARAAAHNAPQSAQRDQARRQAQQGAAAAAEHGSSGAAEVPPAEVPSSPGSPGHQDLAAKAAVQQARAEAQNAPRADKARRQAQQEADAAVAVAEHGAERAAEVPAAESLPLSLAGKAAFQQARAAAQDTPRYGVREHGVSGAAEAPLAGSLPSSGSPRPQDFAAKAAAQEAAAAHQAATEHPGSAAAAPGTASSAPRRRSEAQQQQQPPVLKPDLAKKVATGQEAAPRSSEEQQATTAPEEDGVGPAEASAQPRMPPGMLLEDISGGKEPNVKIPLINTVDDDPIPEFEYIAVSEFSTEELKQRIYRASVSPDKLFVPFQTEPMFIKASEAFEAKPGAKYPVMSKKAYNGYINENILCSEQHKVLSKGVQLPLEVFKTEAKGWGVRCLERIPKGTFICQYAGEVITKEEADSREDSYLFELDHFTNVLDNSIHDHEETMGEAIDPTTKKDIMKRCQASQDPLTIDCRHKGGVARFINHSKFRPNCATTPAIIERNHSTLFYSLCIFSMCDIPAGEEITYDYGLDTAENSHDVVPRWYWEFNAREEAELDAEEAAAKALKKKRKKRRRD